MSRVNRRDILKYSLGLAGAGLPLVGCRNSIMTGNQQAATNPLGAAKKPKFLFVYTATGGASVNDSFLALRHEDSSNHRNINAYPDRAVESFDGTDLRAVNIKMDSIGPLPFPVNTNQSEFVKKYKDDIMVATMDHSSVSHPIGQKRAITGYDAWNGRTMQEVVAEAYGSNLVIPNINMAEGGFAEHGTDSTVADFARAEFIKNPAFLPFGLHGSKGIQGAPEQELVNLARATRDSVLEPQTAFMKGYKDSEKIQRWLQLRSQQNRLEQLDLINRLNPFLQSDDFPFADFGLKENEKAEFFNEVFENLGMDPIQTQALMGYLLVINGISNAVTFGPGMNVVVDGSDLDNPLLPNPPGGFDYTHNGHRGAQAVCWQQCLSVIDKLIDLLKRTHFADGDSFWDHSMIYLATEHGKDKQRVDGQNEFTSGHHVNNGVVLISPMVNGGKVLGGVDPNSAETYGFDPKTGEQIRGRHMTEGEIYSGILQAMEIETPSGLPDMRAMRKKA